MSSPKRFDSSSGVSVASGGRDGRELKEEDDEEEDILLEFGWWIERID
jgi:hypothetical protein